MIKIDKNELQMLLEKGFSFEKGDLHKTYTKYPHYYATTGIRLMGVLNKYRESKIIK